LRFQDFTALEAWRGMRAALIPNLNLLDGLPSANNFDPLLPGWYKRWMDEVETLDPQTQKAWLALAGVGTVENIDASQPGGVRFDLVVGARRWHWYACSRGAAGLAEAWRALEPELSAPPRPNRAVILENAPPEPAEACTPPQEQAEAHLVAQRPDRLVIQVDAPAAGWLVLADTWYPGWHASQDGVDAPVYRGDGLFRAVRVEAGKHEITFNYRPAGFYFGGLFSILSLLCIWILKRWGRISAR
jgi:hypothetical protein